MTDIRLIRLRLVAEIVRTRAVAELEANRRAEADLEREAAGLRAVGVDVTPGAYHYAGRETVWLQWRDTRIASLNRERAQLRVAREGLEAKAGRAAARLQVLDRLATEPR